MTGTRVLTAVVLVPVVVGIVLFAPTWVVALCVAGVILLSLREFFALGEKAGLHGYPIWTTISAVTLVFSQWALWEIGQPYVGAARMSVLQKLSDGLRFSTLLNVDFLLVVFLLGIAVAVVVSKRPLGEGLGAASVSAAGLLFIGYPLTYLIALHGSNAMGPTIVLFTLVLVWAGDTAAYFVGGTLGRHKLTPALSPGKTWEGVAANVLASAGVAVAFVRWIDLPWTHLLGAGLVVSVAGQVGDLLESALKRSAGVKDSGALLPGHGGVLDRIDALVLAAPAVWWYFRLLVSR